MLATSTKLLVPRISSIPSRTSPLTFSHLRSFSSTSTRPSQAPRSPLAFCFDIDGVLKTGPQVLPQAIRTLALLNSYSIPYILLTNGGGRSEKKRAESLSNELQTTISPDQIFQAHTALQSLLPQYRTSPIFVVGGPESPPGNTRKIMESYGFENVYTSYDLHASYPAAWPFTEVRKRQKELTRSLKDLGKGGSGFKAVIVFHDSREWGRDIQLMIDVMRSRNGIFGTQMEDDELAKSEQIPVYFSHGDFLWGNDFPISRFGQGAFKVALSSIWQKLTSRPFEYTTFGKPEKLTYEFADNLLKDQYDIALQRAESEGLKWPEDVDKNQPPKIFMVGDNTASDIMGANQYGWQSILVKTGVFRDTEAHRATLKGKLKPTMIADDVEQGVREVLRQEWGVEVGTTVEPESQ